MSKISIIVPVYNTEEFVELCIESLLKQTYRDIEIVLVNDGSSKNCKVLLENIAKRDKRIKLFHLNEQSGVGAARNLGITKATGEWLYFVDSDDYVPEKTLEILQSNIKEKSLIVGRIRNTYFDNSTTVILEGVYAVKKYWNEKRYHVIKRLTAVNMLIRRDFVTQHQLFFSEKVAVYADVSFIFPAVLYSNQIAYMKDAIYFHRKRLEPSSQPPLMQRNEAEVIKDYLLMYNEVKNNYDEEELQNFIDVHFLNFYRKKIITFYKHHDESQLFEEVSTAMGRVAPELIKKYNWILKRETKALVQRNLDKYRRISKRHHFLRDLRRGISTKRRFNIFLYRRFFSQMKMSERLVVFESFAGKSYSDNPKYIYEYMTKQNMNFKFVWILNGKKKLPGSAIQVKRFSIRYFYYFARAKYWVSNSRLPKYLDKREGAFYLQTWHGTPLKRLAQDMDAVYMPGTNTQRYKRNFYEQSRRWDYLISPNPYSTKVFRQAFLFNKEMLEHGYPRNDILYQKNNQKDIMKLKRKLKIPVDKKVILYAPTWRDDEFYGKGAYKFNLKLELDTLQQHISKDYVIILRLHYLIAEHIDLTGYEDFVFEFTSHDDIAELYLISDILITDYSSVFFDYANLKRPILFFTYDLEKYRDTLRGFYIDMEKEIPGPLLMTTDEVVEAILNIDTLSEKYEEKYKQFHDKYCMWDDGNAAEKTVQHVFK
ncbi:bifunctional glycosyltransferase family 2 protein/CDP-glycerol:glycerophosphate glycerophosphotransferase [Virgibacillus soli]|uniref:Bifunctional glycosyltransferase family 2 protein/CDP-glycerol:glycerophosphate glycerophosphotransferase n=1 Tax=Paracerasibacillus soli TaxID=480284 RepID=A0ABU5CSV7_9BACI|nr:bifunctional glycosyltransferase family 2 protein/CDP-glycerol:glycerophosphate glycerophosphotransferase [Virgibacillus soli]MDY0409442.1 bifunctional glycosyltransferase family 2 protein/CDP-glycerol:glycerophosphate glycerophosphotransferase [Virgibacillus soli]